MRTKHFFMAILVLLSFSTILSAQVPQLINFQGQLDDANGNAANGVFSMVFAIYDAASGGTSQWTETQTVTATGGVFNVLLGSITPIETDVFDSGTQRFLQITVEGNVLTPRRQFASVPYAITSGGLSSVENLDVDNSNGEVAVNLTSDALSGIINTFSSTGNDRVLISSTIDGNAGAMATFDDDGNLTFVVTTTDLNGGDITVQRGGNLLGRMTNNVAGHGFMALYNATSSLSANSGSSLDAIVGQEVITLTTTPEGDGSISVNNADGTPRVTITQNVSGHGSIETFRDDGRRATQISTTPAGDGTIVTFNRNNQPVIEMNTTPAGDGIIIVNGKTTTPERVVVVADQTFGGRILTFNVNDILVASLGTVIGDAGGVRVNYPAGNPAGHIIGDNGLGQITLFNPSTGTDAVAMSANGAGGQVIVGDAGGISRITLDGPTGKITANALQVSGSKQFVIDHPLDPNKEIHYVSLEGPEAAVFARGTAALMNGEANIQLPDHFPLVANDQGMTVHLTPLSAASEGLAVVGKSTSEIVVKELRNGKGSYEFDYIVHAVRKGYENFRVVRDKVDDPALRVASERKRMIAAKERVRSATDIMETSEGTQIVPANKSVEAAPTKSIKMPSNVQRQQK